MWYPVEDGVSWWFADYADRLLLWLSDTKSVAAYKWCSHWASKYSSLLLSGLKATNCWYYGLVTDPAPPEPNPTHSSLSMVEIILIQSSWFFRPSTSWVGCQRPGWESDGKCLEMFWSVYFQSRSSLWRIVRNFPDPFSARTLTMTRLARARQHSTDLAVPFIFGSCFE